MKCAEFSFDFSCVVESSFRSMSWKENEEDGILVLDTCTSLAGSQPY